LWSASRPWRFGTGAYSVSPQVEQQAFAAHSLNFVIERYLSEKLRHKKKFLP